MDRIKYPANYAPAKFEREVNGALVAGDAVLIECFRGIAKEMLQKCMKWLNMPNANAEWKEQCENGIKTAKRIIAKCSNLKTAKCPLCGDTILTNAMVEKNGELICESCKEMV